MSKHTLGPWRVGDDDATGGALTVWAAEPGVCITSVFDSRLGDDVPPMHEAIANACLIAAGPNLLLAAKEAAVVIADMAKVTGADLRKGTCLPRLLAAIAKAEGREPSP